MKPSYIVLLLLAAFLFVWNVWGYDLWAPDEPYFGEGAREMIADGHWLVPYVNGAVTTDKPPLFFWLIAIFSLPFGNVLSLTARIPSALAMLGSVILTVRLGSRLWGEREGILAGLILATTYLPWDKARSAQIDALLCFLILASLSAFEAFRAGDLKGRYAGFLFWGISALAVLAKGPVGIILPLGIVICTLALDRNLRAWKSFAPITGPLLFFILIGSWALPATLLNGQEYSVWGALKKHFLERAVYGMHHKQPFWYYLKVMPVQLLPWTGLVPGAFLLAWRHRSREKWFLVIWVVFIILFFSISSEKRDLYTLPAFPAVALLMARLAAPWWREESERDQQAMQNTAGRGWITLPQGITGGLFLLVGLVLPFAAYRSEREYLASGIWLAAGMVIGGGWMLVASLVKNPRRTIQATAGTFLIMALVVTSVVFPSLNSVKSIRIFALDVKRITAGSRAAGHQVMTFNLGNFPQAIAFYTDGLYTRELKNLSDLEAHISSTDEVFVIADAAQFEQLPRALRDRLNILLSHKHHRMEIVLASNRSGEHSYKDSCFVPIELQRIPVASAQTERARMAQSVPSHGP